MSGKEELIFIEQFAVRVTDYSSQYGPAVGGISYTANNIIGPPSRFPAYGDFPETHVPKTYGPWWNKSPTAALSFSCEDIKLLGQDFIDVQYETPVYPFCVSVYETHQAGCVRRVWAGDGHGNWFLLNQKPRQKPARHSQIFSSPPRHVNFLTKMLRIEIDSSLADYYPELDAVLLVGTKSFPSITETLKLNVKGLSEKILEMKLHEKITDFRVIENIRLLCSQSFSRSEPEVNICHLSQLPDEILRCILSYLDVRSLCSVASVSTQLNHASRDPLLYTSVNLKPYWHCVNRSALEWLESRCKFLQRLDLSWCGSYGKLGASDFSWFIKKIGGNLRILRLENCTFLNNESIYWISTMCSSLQELSLRGCRQMESTAFWHLGRLKKIKRLVLDHTQIELATLLVTLQSMEQITHLSIAFCHRLAPGGSLDEIIRWLNQHRPNIESLDMWRTGHFSQSGMEMLVGLTHLRGLDLGWCGLPTGYWVSQLANNCRLLQKLFLTATRVVSDADLIALSQCCPHLIQLDILGNAYISPIGCSRVLENCHFLELMDVSYCRQIEESHVLNWIKLYPKVSIQRIS